MGAYFPQARTEPYLYDLLPDYPGRGGKMMRSSLCIADRPRLWRVRRQAR